MGVTSLGPHTRPACTQVLRGSIKLCEECGSNACLCVFFIPWGHVNFYAQIWALTRHWGHMGSMLDADWLIQIFLRSDWLLPTRACFTTAGILVHQNGTPIRRLHTKLYQGAWNVSANNLETVGHKDLRLEQIFYILVFYNTSFSWLLPLDGFQFIFLLRDSDNGLFFRFIKESLLFQPHPQKSCKVLEEGKIFKHKLPYI